MRLGRGAAITGILVLWLAAPVQAARLPDGSYRLLSGSTFSRGCFPPCLCPIFTTDSIQGTFVLTFTRMDGLFDYYAITDVNWTVTIVGQERRISGSGLFQIGGEFALQQRLRLDLTMEGQTNTFDSGLVPTVDLGPEIDAIVSVHRLVCLDTAIKIHSRPTDQWTRVAAMPAPKMLHGLASGNDGRVYAFGGTSDDGPPVTATVFAYNIDLDSWTPVSSLAAGPRRNFAYASDTNGLLYAIGGYDFSGPPFALSRVEQYDPQVDVWTQLPDMPTPRQGAAAATGLDGRIYVMGGTDTSFQPTAVTEIYDPVSATWTTAAPMMTPRTGFGAAAGLDGLIYVFGGYSGEADVNSAEAYDPTSDTWTPVASMNVARYGVAGVTGPDGRLFAIGGDGDPSVEVYDLSTGTWTFVRSLTTSRSGHAATLGPDHRIYVAGGDTAGSVEVYIR
jgi:N-acetylneuraminic acid mutarotase